ncbi:MAG: RibD family protein, partial [Bdellovibrionales bacterium]
RLSHEGIEIVEGIETEACKRLIHAFAFHAATGKPFVTVKRAFDENGSMVPSEKKKTFTSKESLILAHRLRKKADAIVTGSGTILADNPLFTVRHVPDHKGKQRYLAILDRRGRVPHDYIEQAEKRGLDAFIYKDVDRCFSDLTARGVRDILLEAGPLLSRAILGSAHWTMLVDIHKGEPDRVEVSFNENAPIPFDTQNVELETLLPL